MPAPRRTGRVDDRDNRQTTAVLELQPRYLDPARPSAEPQAACNAVVTPAPASSSAAARELQRVRSLRSSFGHTECVWTVPLGRRPPRSA